MWICCFSFWTWNGKWFIQFRNCWCFIFRIWKNETVKNLHKFYSQEYSANEINLNNAAKSSINYKQQLNAYKSRDVDVTNFEDNLKRWKEDYNGNYIKARKRFGDAIKEIDKTINTLNKIKENLLGSEKQLTHVNDKIQGMTIRKLTHNSPTMKEKFKFIKDKDNK